MLCENCNENEATIHYTEIINGVKTEHHLCSECAAKLDLSGYANVLNSDFPFVKLLTGLLASSGLIGEEVDNPMSHVKCPQCSMSFEEFTQVGKFGCAECYDVFGPLIEDNMKKLQGSTEHKGKVYKKKITGKNSKKSDTHTEHGQSKDHVIDDKTSESSGAQMDVMKKIAELDRKLKEAVHIEDYEAAAKYRDQIKALREGKEKNA
jgi:protein arginine kinase activator